MKLGSDYLQTGKLEAAQTDSFGEWAGNASHPLAELVLTVEFATVTERRKAFATKDGDEVSEQAVRDFYLSKVKGWNIEDVEFGAEPLARLLDTEPRLEAFIVAECNELARFL